MKKISDYLENYSLDNFEGLVLNKILAEGAEAVILQGEFKNQQVAIKQRINKKYRVKELDEELIYQRTKSEVKILKKADSIILVPKVILFNENTIIMQYIDGIKLRDYLTLSNYQQILKKVGTIVAKLHQHDIIHQDLTTSNMIFLRDEIYFIDFGLSFISQRIEDRGVDLHLFKEALESKHFELKDGFDYFLQGYICYDKYSGVIERLKDIEKRGRYKHK